MSLLSIFLYFVFINLSLLIPGYALVKKTKYFSKQPGLELCAGYLTSIIIFAICAVLAYILKLSPDLTRVVSWFVILYGLVETVRLKYYKSLFKLRFPIFCLLALSLMANLFLGLSYNTKYVNVPDPTPQPGANYQVLNVKVLNVAQTQANDNYVPYRQAQFFINRSDPAKDSFIQEWGVGFFERTPLMGSVAASYMNLFNNKPPINYTWSATGADPDHTYQKFQLLAHVLNSLFIIPGFFLLELLFKRKIAVLTSLFLVISQFFLYNAIFSWPKSFVAFFILISWILLIKKTPSYVFIAGLVSGLAYLTHDLAVLYIGASLVYLLINKRLKDMLIFTIPAFLLALPWYIAAAIVYHKPSSFIYYPLSTGGIPQIEHKKQIIHDFFHTSIFRLIKIRIDNLVYLLSPYELLSSEGGQAGLRRIWSVGLFSIPGAVGLGLMVPALLQVLKSIRKYIVWVLILLPVIFSTLIIGWPKGLGALHFAEAIVVLLSGFGISFLTKLKNYLWTIGAYVINAAQLIFFIAYSYSFHLGNWFSNIHDIASILAMAIIVVTCGWLTLQTSKNRPSWLTS